MTVQAICPPTSTLVRLSSQFTEKTSQYGYLDAYFITNNPYLPLTINGNTVLGGIIVRSNEGMDYSLLTIRVPEDNYELYQKQGSNFTPWVLTLLKTENGFNYYEIEMTTPSAFVLVIA